jgi:DNA-binding MarR family transcriptional regulator
MLTPAALPPVIGQAERGLDALLEPLLAEAKLSFTEWTTLIFLDAAEPMTADEVVDRHVASGVASREAAGSAIDRLRSAGLIAPPDGPGRLSLTENGQGVLGRVRRAVDEIAGALFAGLPPADLEATHRTLVTVAQRARARRACAA